MFISYTASHFATRQTFPHLICRNHNADVVKYRNFDMGKHFSDLIFYSLRSSTRLNSFKMEHVKWKFFVCVYVHTYIKFPLFKKCFRSKEKMTWSLSYSLIIPNREYQPKLVSNDIKKFQRAVNIWFILNRMLNSPLLLNSG